MALNREKRVRDSLARLFSRMWADSRGASAVEYGLIMALVVLAMIVSLKGLANTTTGMWNHVSTRVQDTAAQ